MANQLKKPDKKQTVDIGGLEVPLSKNPQRREAQLRKARAENIKEKAQELDKKLREAEYVPLDRFEKIPKEIREQMNVKKKDIEKKIKNKAKDIDKQFEKNLFKFGSIDQIKKEYNKIPEIIRKRMNFSPEKVSKKIEKEKQTIKDKIEKLKEYIEEEKEDIERTKDRSKTYRDMGIYEDRIKRSERQIKEFEKEIEGLEEGLKEINKNNLISAEKIEEYADKISDPERIKREIRREKRNKIEKNIAEQISQGKGEIEKIEYSQNKKNLPKSVTLKSGQKIDVTGLSDKERDKIKLSDVRRAEIEKYADKDLTVGELKKEGLTMSQIGEIGKIKNKRKIIEKANREGRELKDKELKDLGYSKKQIEAIKEKDVTNKELKKRGLTNKEISEVGEIRNRRRKIEDFEKKVEQQKKQKAKQVISDIREPLTINDKQKKPDKPVLTPSDDDFDWFRETANILNRKAIKAATRGENVEALGLRIRQFPVELGLIAAETIRTIDKIISDPNDFWKAIKDIDEETIRKWGIEKGKTYQTNPARFFADFLAARGVSVPIGKIKNVLPRTAKEKLYIAGQNKAYRPYLKEILKSSRIQEKIKPYIKTDNIDFRQVKELNIPEADALKKTLQQDKKSFVFGSLASRELSGRKTPVPKDVDIATKDITKFTQKFKENLPKNVKDNYLLLNEKIYRKESGDKYEPILDIKTTDKLRPEKNIFTQRGKLPVTGKGIRLTRKTYLQDEKIKKVVDDNIEQIQKLKSKKERTSNKKEINEINKKIDKLTSKVADIVQERTLLPKKQATAVANNILDIPTKGLEELEGVKLVGLGEQNTRKALGTIQVLIDRAPNRAKDPQSFITGLKVQIDNLKSRKPKTKIGQKRKKSRLESLERAYKVLTSKEFQNLLDKRVQGLSDKYPILSNIPVSKIKKVNKKEVEDTAKKFEKYGANSIDDVVESESKISTFMSKFPSKVPKKLRGTSKTPEGKPSKTTKTKPSKTPKTKTSGTPKTRPSGTPKTKTSGTPKTRPSGTPKTRPSTKPQSGTPSKVPSQPGTRTGTIPRTPPSSPPPSSRRRIPLPDEKPKLERGERYTYQIQLRKNGKITTPLKEKLPKNRALKRAKKLINDNPEYALNRRFDLRIAGKTKNSDIEKPNLKGIKKKDSTDLKLTYVETKKENYKSKTEKKQFKKSLKQKK